MSNSPLVDYTAISPNKNVRTQPISKITVHYMAGNLSVETCGNVFASSSRQASSNYGVDSNGRVGLYVPENYRAWTSSSAWNDQRAVTIEVANVDAYGTFSQRAWDRLVELVVDICRRNGIKALRFTGDSSGSLTWHCMYSDTSCPGNYFKDNTRRFVDEVNAILGGDDMPLSDTDIQKVVDAMVSRLPASTWEYVWGEDQNRDNMYNRVSAILANTYGINDSLESVMARLTMPTPVVPFGGEVHRLYKDGAHTYTNSSARLTELTRNGWDDEGVKFALSTGGDAVYELVNPYDNDCVLTVDMREAENLAGAEWQSFGIVGTSGDGAEVHRLHDPNGLHLFTTDEAEAESLKSAGWTYEGVAFQAA